MLSDRGVECIVVDIFIVKPLNVEVLNSLLNKTDWVLVVEESINLSSISEPIAKAIVESSNLNFYRSLNLGDSYLMGSAKREWAWKKFNLNAESIVKYVENFLGISKL